MNRRDYIKLSTLASIGLVSASGTNLYAKSTKKEVLNLGIIGTGSRGAGIISILNKMAHIKVVAVCDVLPFRLTKAVENSGAKGYTNYQDLLDHKGLDAVLIATPFGMHGQMCLDAIHANKHVYCEKTLVKGIDQTQKVLDAYRGSSGLVFQTGHQYNSAELYQKVHAYIDAGYLGDITGFVCQWNRNTNWRRPVPEPKYERQINWRMYREHSGGLTAELCSHQIDFINRVIQQVPEKISGTGGIDHWNDGRETFDNIRLNFQYPSGIDATFMCTTTNAFGGYQIRVMGSEATVVMGLSGAKIYLEKKNKELATVDGVSGATATAWQQGKGVSVKANTQDSTAQGLEQFYQSIVNGKKVYADIKSGALTSKCVQMSLDAMYEDKIAKWDEYPSLRF